MGCICLFVTRMVLAVVLPWPGLHGTADGVNRVSDMSQRDVYLRVTTIVLEPYVMVRWDQSGVGGPPVYEGYMVDLMDELTKLLGLKYRLLPVGDGQYGYRRSDGTWDGMIGQLIRKEADLAAAPLYITEQRENVIDFSIPFLVNHATILLRRPPTGLRSPIENVNDLVNQWQIQYGTLNTGMIIKAFRTSNHTLYSTLWKKMRSFRPSTLTDTNEDGISRVRQGRYAYILPSTIGDYIVRRSPCNLITVDRFLMDRGFGLAVTRGSSLKKQLDKVLTILRRNGFLEGLYDKWWTKRSECNGIKSSKMYSLGGGSRSLLKSRLWGVALVISGLLCSWLGVG